MFAKSTSQSTPKASSQGAAARSMSTPMQVPASAQDGSAGQLSISQIQSTLKCKLPGCQKACFMEVSGRVHDFCCKAHALTYTQQPNQPTARPPGPPLTMPEGISTGMFVH